LTHTVYTRDNVAVVTLSLRRRVLSIYVTGVNVLTFNLRTSCLTAFVVGMPAFVQFVKRLNDDFSVSCRPGRLKYFSLPAI